MSEGPDRRTEPTHPMISPHSAQATTRVQGAPPPSGPPAWDGPPPPTQSPQRTALERMKELPGKVSIRWRLTLTYSALVFAAAAVLLFSVYAIIGRAISDAWPALDLGLPPLQDAQLQSEWRSLAGDAVQQARDALFGSAFYALLGVAILALIIGYFVADRAMRPVAQMTATARKLSESTLAHQRIALEGPSDELKELADTFDAMLTRLNVAFDTQRRFVANASHELRTPLTINRTVLEIALSDPEASEDLKALGRTLLEVNARNEKLIEGLLLLARSERELAVRKPLDVREVAQTAVDQVTPFAEEHGVTLTTELVSAPTVGDPVLLERSVSNLLENAVKYNIPENGKVWIRTGMVDGALVVQVANTGQHVPAYEVNSLFEPFRRLHADRVDSAKGSGLGLSIVRAVVQAHGGNVTAVPRDGGGLVVTMRLPSR
ncbi:Signal transduction histidine kinase [Nonomuraea maritima]|uniref:histidine kinase n=2 Tax=Nonomuraea maritima TaxID=683260 RepID=A0A1G9FIS1_9ACTN|nr:HAMP domain-containing sensor histidine kinase [Nonomuraea maritima]SDK88232.1 Signal transduction histidine kinase [Nonomuraea maritima]